MKPSILHRIFRHKGDKVNHVEFENNGHHVEVMQFNDSPRMLVRVDKGKIRAYRLRGHLDEGEIVDAVCEEE